jgi:hypothetical protein
VKRLLVALLLVLVTGGACSSDSGGGGETSATTAGRSTTTSAPSAAGASTTVAASVPATCSSSFGADSGPPPTQGSALTDGRYFGFITSIAAGGTSVKFDVAQLFTGDAAVKAAAEDGGDSPPDNDYWIRNNSPATRTLAVAAGATLCIPTDPAKPTENTKVTPERFTKYAADGEPNAAWIDVRGGDVERVEAQFFP